MEVRKAKVRMLLILAFCLFSAAPRLRPADSEDELKAAAVWLFVQYSQLTPGPDGAITVGVLGRPSFVQVLRRTLKDKSSGGRPVRLADIRTDLRYCQIVYLATDKADEIQRVLQVAQSVHTLTLGESDRFLEQGGAVNLFIADGHLGFEASLEALDRCGITISANLLKFGLIRNRVKGSNAR